MPLRKKKTEKKHIYMHEFLHEQAVESRWVEKSTGDVRMLMQKSNKSIAQAFNPGSDDRLRLT